MKLFIVFGALILVTFIVFLPESTLRMFLYYLPAYTVEVGFQLMYFFFGTGPLVSKKWFGTQRSWSGLLLGFLVGGSAGFFVSNILLGVLLGIGTWIGSMFGSFIKRRIRIKPGGRAPLLDQLDFIIGATIFGSIVLAPTLECLVIALILTPFIHVVGNIICFKVGVKNVPY